jgi:hypothetical protein
MTQFCWTRLGRASVVLACAWAFTACLGGDVGNPEGSPAPRSGPGADHARVTSTIQPIVNGAPLGLPDDEHGIVAIWLFQAVTSTGVTINEWRQACTGTLMTNSLVLTAHHCFGDTWYDNTNVWVSLTGDFHHASSRTSPDGFDVELLTLEDPCELDGSTSGYVRLLQDGTTGLGVMANGYGLTDAPTGKRPGSSVCGSGAVGCPEDPAPLLISSHTTFWDAGEYHHELGIATNDRNQETALGDSGSALFVEVYTRFLDWPVVGVLSSMFRPDSSTWHDQYVPIQEIRDWLCENGAGC